jgi:HSP20 family protein
MNNLIKRQKSQQPATFGSVVDQIFQNNLNRFFDDDFWGLNGDGNRSRIPVNIRDTEKAYMLDIYAPGLRKQDFQLNLSGDMLTVSYKHTEENKNENDKEGWVSQEYRTQEFSRSFKLDDTIDANKISARYEDGVLKLELPKKENAQRLSKSIDVQ